MEIQAAERDMADAYEQYMDDQVDLQNQVKNKRRSRFSIYLYTGTLNILGAPFSPEILFCANHASPKIPDPKYFYSWIITASAR